MKYVVFGAGAIGGGIAAFLKLSGADVAVIARGDHLRAIQREGIHVLAPGIDDRVRLHAVATPEEIPFSAEHFVILTTKSQDTEAALDALLAAAGPETPVLSAQNGVENERQASRRFRDVFSATIQMPADHLNPGEVLVFGQNTHGVLTVGRYPHGADDSRLPTLRVDLGRAGFDVRLSSAPMKAKYGKLLVNLAGVATALCGSASGVSELIRELQEEGEAVLQRAGIQHDSLAATVARRDELVEGSIAGLRRSGNSTWQSASTARSLETPYLNGEIVLLGGTLDVPTPMNRLVTYLAARAMNEGRRPGWITPEEIHVLASQRTNAARDLTGGGSVD